MALQGVLCALLLAGPAHGYRLLATLEGELGPLWETRPSQVYLVLGRMERDGLVRTRRVANANRPDRLLLELTETGAATAERWLEGPGEPSELVVRMAVWRIVRPDGLVEAAAGAAGQRTAVLSRLRRMRAEATDGFQPESLDAEIGRVAAEVRWLEALRDTAGTVVSRPRATSRPGRRQEIRLA